MRFKIIFPKIIIFPIILFCMQWSLANDLTYSTFLGGDDSDSGQDIAVDNAGNAYVTGYTLSTTFPITMGAYETTLNSGDTTVFVCKINSSGSALIYSTYLGAGVAKSITVDSAGNAFITGWAFDASFPVTPGAIDTTFNGGDRDVFITKLDSSGSTLIYSTFLGGGDSDGANSIAIDDAGYAYIAGFSRSNDYPVTANAYDTGFNGSVVEVVVSKLNSDGSDLVYSTFLGGSGEESGYCITVDAATSAYITGYTISLDFPVSPLAYSTSFNGGFYDAFVTKLNASGSALDYSTYLGGSDDDLGYDIAVNIAGEAFVTGITRSMNYPHSLSAYDSTFNGGFLGDAFVTELNDLGSAIIYSSYLGGSDDDLGYCIALDPVDNIYVMGETYSSDFPVTANAFDSTGGLIHDIFITKLNTSDTTLVYSSYLGGDSVFNFGRGLAIDSAGNVFISGETQSSDFPVTVGALDTTYGGNFLNDAFITKLYPEQIVPVMDWMLYSDSPIQDSKKFPENSIKL